MVCLAKHFADNGFAMARAALLCLALLAVGGATAAKKGSASSCVSPDGLVLALPGELKGGAMNRAQPAVLANTCSTYTHVYPKATTACASKAVFSEEGCDTCDARGTASRAGWTPSRPLSGFSAALTMSVWVKPLRSDFQYGEIFGDGG